MLVWDVPIMLNMFEIKNLTTGYSKTLPVTHIDSLVVKRNEPLGIAGINGAGKTTFLKTLAGVIPMLNGEVNFYSKNKPLFFSNSSDLEAYRELLGYCPDVGGLIPAATPMEHVNILLSLLPKNLRGVVSSKAETVFELVGLEEVADKPTGTFSHGMLRRASVALAYLNAHEVVILDEPFDGVDPDGVRKIQNLVQTLQTEGKTVIISSHLINVLAETVDNILVMAGGNVLDLQPSTVFKNKEGLEKYNSFIQEVSVR